MDIYLQRVVIIAVVMNIFLDILQLFYSLHYTSFPFLKGCRLEKGHIVPVLCSHSSKKKKKTGHFNKQNFFLVPCFLSLSSPLLSLSLLMTIM